MALKLRVSENNGLPWTQTQDYINLCRTITRPGDPTTYNPPHPQGHSSTDVTQFQVGLASSNINNLPDVMYQLWPNKEWWEHTKSAKPLPKRDADGNIMYERSPRAWAPRELLDFPILRNLDTISSEEEAWFLEMLLRMDGRIEWSDLLMRMEYAGCTEKDEQKVRNRLQQRMARFREKFVMVSWRDTAGDNNAIKDRVLDKLTPAQLAARGGLGSTRGSTPGSRDSQRRVIPVPGRRPPGRRPPKATNTRKTATHSLPSSLPLPNRQRNVDTNPTMGGVRQPYASTSHATSIGHQHDFEVCSPSPSHEATIPIKSGRTASIDTHTQTEHGRQSTVYAANQSARQSENTLYAGPSENLREPDPLLGVEEDWDGKDFGSGEGDDGDDKQGNEESSDNYDDDGSDWNEEADADMLSTEESPRMKSLTPEECCELERYLKENRIWTQMCLNGMISVDELMLDMQNNEEELKQGLKRTRGETSDDEIEELQGWRAKRTRREESATGSSSNPLSQLHNSTCNGFDHEQLGPSGEYRRQGALAKTSSRPTTRPVGSAVQRLHNDRLRRPPPKATVGSKNMYEFLHYPQPELVMDEEWTVFHSHIDPQPRLYPLQQPGVEEGLYPNIGQRQGRLAPYESRQYNIIETMNPNTNAGERQLRPSSHHQRQPDGPQDSDNSSDSGSSSDPVESARNENEPTAPRPAHQQPAARTIQDDPFFPDELFNDMLNGQPHNNHVGSIYTRSQQQEIDEYYQRLMAPRPRPQAETNAREDPMPPPPRPRMQQPRTAFAADLQNPHHRPQARQGGVVPQRHIPHHFPVAHAQTGNAPPVAQVTQDESNPAVDATTSWNAEWSAFINDHDADPLLRAHYPEKYPPGSPPGTPQP